MNTTWTRVAVLVGLGLGGPTGEGRSRPESIGAGGVGVAMGDRWAIGNEMSTKARTARVAPTAKRSLGLCRKKDQNQEGFGRGGMRPDSGNGTYSGQSTKSGVKQ
jgi:hypothetical protein